MKHKIIRSKMKKGKPLMRDKRVSRYVPKTVWFSNSNLHKKLKTYSTVYIKPDKGNQGKGIIRVERLNDSKSIISFSRRSIKCRTKKVTAELKKIMNPKKEYIIQQGIDLATYHGRPFDIRVVFQKPLNRWQLTWISAKVADKKNSVVTNVARGAKDVKIDKVLKGMDQNLNVSKIRRELIKVSHQIVRVLNAHFPLTIVGLDLGIDKKGRIWFIEANTKPDFSGLRKFDPKMYQKYLKAKKLIDKK